MVKIPKLMEAVLFHGPQDLRLEKISVPKAKEHEVLIRVKAALTCGTDFKAFRQGHPVLLNNQIPSPFGHEVSGIIEAFGSKVLGFALGDRIVAANSAPCDKCFYCQEDQPNLCENRFLLNGAYAEYLLIPKQIVKHNLYKIPAHLDFQAAALTEPLACVVHAYDQLQLKPGQTLAIFGCGFMGNLFTQIAKANDIKVIAIGRSPEKLELAKTLGADEVLSILDHEDPVKPIRSMTPGKRGADAVIEAIGTPETWQQALNLVRPGGTLCLYGGCKKGSKIELDTHRIHYEELKIVGVFHHTPKHFRMALNYLSQGAINIKKMIHGEIALKEIPNHFQRTSQKPFFKTAVLP